MSRIYLIFFSITLAGCDWIGDENQSSLGIIINGTEVYEAHLDPSISTPQLDARPKISPDGRTIAFSENFEIYLLDIETGERRLLTRGSSPDWSPDGQWLAFWNFPRQIYKIKVNGDSLTQVTDIGANVLPSWSNNGAYIAYLSIADNLRKPAGISYIRPNGMDDTWAFLGGDPDWFPDNEHILAIRGIQNKGIKLITYDRTQDLVRDTLDAVFGENNHYPQVSPEGGKIVFENQQGIWLMDSDGSNLKHLVASHLLTPAQGNATGIWARGPSWHPDGKRIIYEQFRITRAKQTQLGLGVAGYRSFRLLSLSSRE